MRALLAAALALAVVTPAGATWKAEYASVAPAIRQWYESRTLTKAAQARLGFHSCCAHADTVKTKFKASPKGDAWFWLLNGQWQQVPPDIIHWNEHAPSGEPVLFAVGGTPVCFFPPSGGI